MKNDARVWVDIGLLAAFPATVLTGIFHGPGWFPCYWHSGLAVITMILVAIHLLINENALKAVFSRFSRILYGRDPETGQERILRDDDSTPSSDED